MLALLRIIKSPIFIVFFVMLFIVLLLQQPSNPTSTIYENSDSRKLQEVLRAASMKTRTVILTILDKSWATPGSILDLFIESFRIGERTKHLLNHLIIVALDSQTLHYCESIHPHCFHLKSRGQKRNDLLIQVLQFGYNLVYTDVDVMWLRNPLPLFDGVAEISIGCDAYSSNQSNESKKASGEFFYMKAFDLSIQFLKFWDVANVLYPYTRSQSTCEIALTEETRLFGIRIKFIDTTYISGLCQPNRGISETYVLKANCCEELENKVHDLKIVLDDARKSKALLTETSSLETLPSLGSAPKRCFT